MRVNPKKSTYEDVCHFLEMKDPGVVRARLNLIGTAVCIIPGSWESRRGRCSSTSSSYSPCLLLVVVVVVVVVVAACLPAQCASLRQSFIRCALMCSKVRAPTIITDQCQCPLQWPRPR